MWKKVKIMLDPTVRSLCKRPYTNHSRGCPNFNRKMGCPPRCLTLNELLDLSKPVWAIYNVFQFGLHVRKMKKKHPSWSKRQLECCLYWQPKARKQLKGEIDRFKKLHPELLIVMNPEASGVNVTDTMKSIGVELEWPPKTLTYQVILAGTRA